jgi:transposase-like protein
MLKNDNSFDLIRRAVEFVPQELIKAGAAAKMGAQRYERAETRTNERNRHRERTLAHQDRGSDLEDS